MIFTDFKPQVHARQYLYRDSVTIFCFRFFHESFPPKLLEITLGSFRISRRYSKVKVHHWYERHQLLATSVNYTCGKFFNYTCNKFATGFQRQRGLICRRWQWHQWQIMGTISDCLHLNMNLKKTFIYMLTGYQRCPNKLFKTFPIKDFFHLPPVSTTLVVHLELWISLRIF